MSGTHLLPSSSQVIGMYVQSFQPVLPPLWQPLSASVPPLHRFLDPTMASLTAWDEGNCSPCWRFAAFPKVGFS